MAIGILNGACHTSNCNSQADSAVQLSDCRRSLCTGRAGARRFDLRFHPVSTVAVLAILMLPPAARGGSLTAAGIVEDESGRPVHGAHIILTTANGLPLARTETTENGQFHFPDLKQGEYLLEVSAPPFRRQRRSLRLTVDSPSEVLRVVLAVRGMDAEVSVTASPGFPADLLETPQQVHVEGGEALRGEAHPHLGTGLAHLPGVHLQQTTAGQASPFLRGMTGFHVLHMVDGVRLNNSYYRFGPNQYIVHLDPHAVERVETILGPAAVEYGSDSLGGTIHVLTPQPPAFTAGRAVRGRVNTFFSSADLSTGAAAQFAAGATRAVLQAGGSWRHHNDLRGGGGLDSHHALRRLFGLEPAMIRSLTGNRLQETAYSQRGTHLRFDWRISGDHHLAFWHQDSRQRGVRSYKDLWGGLGRLRASFEPQSMRLLYLRHTRYALGPLDSLTSTISFNRLQDGFLSQGLNDSDPVFEDRVRAGAVGYTVQARAHRGRRQTYLFGGELYDEKVDSRRLVFPPGPRYRSGAFYGQMRVSDDARRIGLTLGSRMTLIRFRERAFRDITFNNALTIRLSEGLRLHLRAGRGFRAPNLHDLGTAGLQDLGYEIPAEALAGSGAMIGTHSGESALSTGRLVRQLGSERLFNYEAGLAWQGRRTYARGHVFLADLFDAISRRTVLFPTDGAPHRIAGVELLPIPGSPGQETQGVTAVATRFDPRAVKAFVNVGRHRYAGTEIDLRLHPPGPFHFNANYTYLSGRERDPAANVRRLPPQQGRLSLFYQASVRVWIELAAEAQGRQDRLSGGDLSDERIGGERSRIDIAAFFLGRRVQPFIRNGVFLPTGESLPEIQTRVLPRALAPQDTTRVPLYDATPGFAVFHIRTGVRAGENSRFHLGVQNLLDRNYRRHGSGIDGPGINLVFGWELRF